MDERIQQAVVTFRARADPGGTDEAMDLLAHVDDYDPDGYSRRLSNVASLDPEMIETGQVLFADHVPSASDAREEEPNVFMTDYEDDGILVQFSADYDALDDFLAAVDHVLSATDLDVTHLRVLFRIGVDVTPEGNVHDLGGPEGFLLEARIDSEGGQSLLALESLTGDLRLTDSTDPIRERVEEALAFATGQIPGE